MKLRFQIGSNRPLPKRKARMFCAGSLPRKWSMRKIWSSSNTSCNSALSATALSRSVPNGFSMIDPRALGQAGLREHFDRRQRRVRRHAEIVDELEAFRRAPPPPAGRPRPAPRALVDRDVIERGVEGRPVAVGRRVVVMLFDRLVGEVAELVFVISSSETPMIRHFGMKPAVMRWKSPGRSFRCDRSPVAPNRTTICGSFGTNSGRYS